MGHCETKTDKRRMDLMSLLLFIIGVICTTVLTLWIVLKLLKPNNQEEKQGCISVCMVLGSGSHTTEMVALSRALDRKVYTPRTYIIAETDLLSKIKIEKEESGTDGDVRLITIPRSREVGQSYISSIATTTYAFIG